MDNLDHFYAYVGGFFDGEGSIGIYKNNNKNPGYSLRTQVTQNKSPVSLSLYNRLIKQFGGNLSEQITLSGDIKYNWQLNAAKATVFLETILPFLLMKSDQAKIAILWQRQRPIRIRTDKGRIALSTPENKQLNIYTSELIKVLKKKSIQDLIDSGIPLDHYYNENILTLSKE